MEWVPYEEILTKPTWEGDYVFMNWLLEEQPFFSAKFRYEDNRLVEQEVTFYG